MPAELVIAVDHRERESLLAACLEAEPGVSLVWEQLEAGDYLAAGLAVFERKTIADFARSIVDGRLFRQAAQLAAHPLPAALILEGRWPDAGPVEGVGRRALLGALASLGMSFRLPVLPSSGPRESAGLICYAARQLGRTASGALPRPGYRPRGRLRRQLFLLQGLPGIGPGRAARLLERFGAVERVFTATQEELAEVSGIGARTARAIRDAVRESRARYGCHGAGVAE